MERERNNNPLRGLVTMVRTITAFTSIKVVLDAVGDVGDRIFKPECPHCRGCGIMTCPRCRGSKSVRTRPVRLVRREPGAPPLLLQRQEEVMQCFECGTRTESDFHKRNEISRNDTGTSMIINNFQNALVKKPMPNILYPTAGTVACPVCRGARHVSWGLGALPVGRLLMPAHNPWLPIAERNDQAGVMGDDGIARKVRRKRYRTTKPYLEFARHARPLTEADWHPDYFIQQMFLPQWMTQASREDRSAPVDRGAQTSFMYPGSWQPEGRPVYEEHLKQFRYMLPQLGDYKYTLEEFGPHPSGSTFPYSFHFIRKKQRNKLAKQGAR